MAKRKGKSGSGGGPHKNHGPKRKLFAEFKPMIKSIADAGLLDKYHNYESFVLACTARGKRNTTKRDFAEFVGLTRAQQKEYLAKLSK